MVLSSFRRFERIFAFIFVFTLTAQAAYPAISFSQKTMAPGSGQPVSAATTSMVDPYTGDFHYSVPLLTVPGPNGESVDVSANYHAGIRVDEKASWLGLGWDYNPGEISRQVMGAPDDAAEFPIFSRQRPILSLSDQYASTSYVGAFYPAKINNTPSYASFPNPSFTPFNPRTKSMDIFANDRILSPSERSYMLTNAPAASSRFRKYSLPYRSLAYDHYMVSSPGLSGQLRPYYFGNMDLVENKNANASVTISSSSAFNKKAQFYFENSVQKNVTSQSSADLNAQNMLKSGVYVKYYTNADINNSANLYNNATQVGFLDYKVISSGSRRSGVDNDGIGAFEITDPNGMTYHYSLAVYASEEAEKGLNYDNSLNYSFKPAKYASSWKLTAVTGPDYTDANNDHMADVGDSGYWIAYNYSLWSSSYLWSSNQYGLKDDIYAPNFLYNQQGPNSVFGWVSANYVPNGYIPKKSVITGKTEVYYLNNIQTATHTALFVKSIRQDEQSYDAIATGGSPVPMLKLDRVILLRNEDLGTLYASANPLSGTDLDNRFSYTTCSTAQGDPYFMNASKYRLFKNSLDQNALKSAVFTQDYSLCRKYAYSINTHYTAGTTYLIYEPSPNLNPMVNATSVIGYKTGSYSYSDANDGKLTLTNITFLDLQSQRVTPGFDFDYAQTDATKNPDYDMNKTDLWGFYKSDWQAGYSHNVSVTSKDYTSAWSLRGVTSPLNGKMQVEYESDDYTAEGFADDANLVLNPNFATFQVRATEPSLIFPIQSASAPYQTPCDACFGDFSFENPDFSGFYNQYATDNTGLFDAAELVVPSVRYCYNVPNNNGFTTYYYTVNTVGQIGKNSIPSNNVWNFSLSYPSGVDLSGNPIMSQGGVTDLDMQSVCSSAVGGYGVSNYNKYFSYAYVIFKMKKLYGGGIRVKTIKTIASLLNNTYTESYTYDKGYCPNVPKKFTLESFSGPSYYALCMNNKTGLEGVSSNVGYSTVTVSHVSMNNTSNGKTVLTFRNNPVNNPIVATFEHPQSNYYPCNQSYEPSTVCGSYAVHWDHTDANNQHFLPVPNIDLQIYFAYDNKELISLGQLKSTELYADGATTPVLSTVYQYPDINSYSYLGENYNYLKIEDPHHYNYNYFSCRDASSNLVSQHYASCDPNDTYTIYYSYINRDCFLASTATTRDGITISEEVLTRDPNTGTPLKTRTLDPTQGVFVNTSKPAYLDTSYNAMGLKSVNEGYKNQPNMMESTQKLRFPYSAASLNVDETTDPNASIVVSENKNTFSTSYPYRVYNPSSAQYENSTQTTNWWRLYETYTRLLDDVTSYNITSYNWRKLSEGTLYDTENNKIEEKGLNDRKAASKWGYGNRYKLAAISNANYNSFTFTGFEDKFRVAANIYHFGGEVTGGQYQYTSVAQVQYPGGPRAYPSIAMVNPHTGYYLARVPASTDGPAFTTSNFETGRTYTAKVWVHRASASSAKLAIDLVGYINPGGGAFSVAVNTHKEISKTDNNNVTVGDWILMSVDIIVPDKFDLTAAHHMSVYLRNSASAGDAFFDDFAFHPKDAAMSGNVYEVRSGLLKAQLDNDNFATLYNYDNAGRVVSVYKEYSGGVKKITENQYHFSKP